MVSVIIFVDSFNIFVKLVVTYCGEFRYFIRCSEISRSSNSDHYTIFGYLDLVTMPPKKSKKTAVTPAVAKIAPKEMYCRNMANQTFYPIINTHMTALCILGIVVRP